MSLTLLPPSRRAPVRFFDSDTTRIVGFSAHAVKRAAERGVDTHAVASRLATIDPTSYQGRGPRRFKGSDGLFTHAAPWSKGWHVITVWWQTP